MSARIDQSLDNIIDSQKKNNRNKRRTNKRPAPVGGVKKATKVVQPVLANKKTPATRLPTNSKIVVSGLPLDVTEAQIKEYFGKSVGPIKRVSLHYNQRGESRGIADITFVKPDSANKAAREQNGIKIDTKPMKIEVVLEADHAPAPAPVKSMAERVVANSKAQPKSAVAKKDDKANKKDGKAKPGNKKPANKKNARPKPKTAEELDAEMTDYWNGGNNAAGASTAAAAPAATADAMEEISV